MTSGPGPGAGDDVELDPPQRSERGAAVERPGLALGSACEGKERDRLLRELAMTSPVAQIVVASDRRLALVNRAAETRLGLSARDLGRPFSDLAIADAVAELPPRLAAALEGRDAATLRDVAWRRQEDATTYLDIEMVPIAQPGDGVLGLAISFTDSTRIHELQGAVDKTLRQLKTAHEVLLATNEELTSTVEELEATNEELQSTNAELQSTAEELEATNEELQSSNVELVLIGERLQDRSSTLTRLDSLMRCFFDSLRAAVVVVDRELVVQVWSTKAEELWGLREVEAIGRPLLSLDGGVPSEVLRPWLASVVGGAERHIEGRHLDTVDPQGRAVTLKVTVTAVSGAEDDATGAVVLLEASPR